MKTEKNLQLERTVFFCDAVVAIAITLLALDIKIAPTASGHLAFSDIAGEWKTFSAFFLSFLNIASFWKTHHSFFSHIQKIDEKLLAFNIGWLFFIVTLPFATSLVSSYFFDTPAILLYSLNILMIACCQNMIWDYASINKGFISLENIDEPTISRYRVYCNLDMINGLLAIGLSFFNPMLAFIFLFTKLPMIVLAKFYYKYKARKNFKENKKP
ncbi:TMEM175 family protein [Flavobacterium sp. 3HN19-14]|uniref:TMEM175 family protein n=1 Tax=Flavobacterium sp. 3HN19-14 TaxID=3448133 RepID=UPI003EE3A732